MKRNTIALSIVLLFASTTVAGNWPSWRGPNGDGTTNEKNIPTQWSDEDNVAWRVDLPGEGGNSSPIVWGDHVFLTVAENKGAKRHLIAFDRDNGKVRWTRTAETEPGRPTHKTNPYAGSSPVTDGKAVYVWHGSAGFYAYDFDGKELWKKNLGEFKHIWGYASSPILYKDLVILSAGPGTQAFIAAFDKKTGKEEWRISKPEWVSPEPGKFMGSWSTPAIRKANGRDELVIGMPEKVWGFDPETGKALWWASNIENKKNNLVYTSPMIAGDIVIVFCGYGGPGFAVNAVGDGDLTSKRLWVQPRNSQRIGTGVIVDGHLHFLNENGTFEVIDVKTGDVKVKDRLSRKSWSSLTLVDGRIYAIDTRGITFICKPSTDDLDVLEENEIGEFTNSTPAFSDGQIFIRTYESLFCIGSRTRTVSR